MDEGVSAQDQPIAGLRHPQGQIIILVIPRRKPFVKQADLLEDRSLDQHAEPDQLEPLFPLPRIGPVEILRKGVHFGKGGVMDLDRLGVTAVVGHRSDGADALVALQAMEQIVQPVARHNGIIVQQQNILSGRPGNALVASRRKSGIMLVSYHDEIRLLRKPGGSPVVGTVVHHDDFVCAGTGIPADAFDALFGIFELILHEYDDAGLVHGLPPCLAVRHV